MSKTRTKLIFIATALSILQGCSESDSSGAERTDPGELQTAYFVDSPVQGLVYERSDGFVGVTDEEGAFHYYLGDTIEFKVGSLSLGTLRTERPEPGMLTLDDPSLSRALVTPLTISDDADKPEHNAVVNKLIFLQTLDEDGVLENGIVLSEAIHEAFENSTLDFSIDHTDFMEGDFAEKLQQLNQGDVFTSESARTVQSKVAALRHFDQHSQYAGTLFQSRTRTFHSRWESGDCTLPGNEGNNLNMVLGIKAEIKDHQIDLCSGVDGCFEGYIQSDGDILFSNTTSGFCEDSECETPLDLNFNLRYENNLLTGTIESSCYDGNQLNKLAHDPIFYSADRQELARIRTEIDDMTSNLSCNSDSDCSSLVLDLPYSCGRPQLKPFSTIGVDMVALEEKQKVYAWLDGLVGDVISLFASVELCYGAHRASLVCNESRQCAFEL